MIPLLGFAPDSDPTKAGVLTDCVDLIPTNKGLMGRPSLQTPINVPALGAACKGAATVTKLDGTRRVFANTTAAIYELSGGVWTDRSAVGGYSGDVQWSIAQFGDSTLMSNGVQSIHRSTSTSFAAIAGAPKASIIFTVGAFVMALNVDDGASKPNGWHCCAAYDDTDWTPSTTTQSASGQLVSTPGSITAGAALGEYAVAFKTKSMYMAQYVGGDTIWDWQRVIGGNAGCIGKRAVCDLDGALFFVGEDNFWMFSGQTPTPLGDNIVKEWWRNVVNSTYISLVECVYDKTTGLVWIFYPTSSSTLDSALVYHVPTQRFGKATLTVETIMEYVTPSLTIDGMDSYGATIDALPDIPFDSPYWTSSSRALAVFNSSHQMQTLSGNSTSSSLTTGDVGDDYGYSLLQKVKCRYITAPTSASLSHYYKDNSGDSYTVGESVSGTHVFDLLWSSRWHKVQIDFTGPVEITGVDAKYVSDGEE